MKGLRSVLAVIYPVLALGLIAAGLTKAWGLRLELLVPGALMWLDFQGVFSRFRRAR